MNEFRAVLYLIGFISLTYMIYRYARYSPWRSQPIGRAFMMMKSALWALLALALIGRVFPEADWRSEVQFVLIAYAVSAIIYQTVVVVDLQGGISRKGDSQVLNDTDRAST